MSEADSVCELPVGRVVAGQGQRGPACGKPASHVWHSLVPGRPWGDSLKTGTRAPLICDEHAAMLTDAEADPLPDCKRRTRSVDPPVEPVDAATAAKIDAAMREAGAEIVRASGGQPS